LAAGLLPQGENVVELGCGRGVLLQYLRDHGFPRCIGIELDPERVELCRSRGLDVRRGTAQAIPLEPESCGAVVMECVYSLCEPVSTVPEIARILRPGGTLVLTDLYAHGESVTLSDSPLCRRVPRREELEAELRACFALERFLDQTDALRQFVMQMLFSGAGDGDCTREALRRLKPAKPGYGVWVWKKNSLR
jgi:arsenite methyltransferase